MKITEVKSKADKKAFLEVARIIYKNDNNWVCPLDNDIEAVFDPARNNFHTHGKATRWILKTMKGTFIGRVAAFINEKRLTITSSQPAAWVFLNAWNKKEAGFFTLRYRKSMAAGKRHAGDGWPHQLWRKR
jgi:hypothetical protein